uniref:Uncharacterized protein n=1 Tax=Helianthus annuus TaxID=4232 RepID=A0A251TSX6_HELAN
MVSSMINLLADPVLRSLTTFRRPFIQPTTDATTASTLNLSPSLSSVKNDASSDSGRRLAWFKIGLRRTISSSENCFQPTFDRTTGQSTVSRTVSNLPILELKLPAKSPSTLCSIVGELVPRRRLKITGYEEAVVMTHRRRRDCNTTRQR